MNLKKFIDVRLVIISIVVMSLAVVLGTSGKKLYLPTENIEVKNVSDVANDEANNSYVVNNSGTQVVRMNPDGDVDLVLDCGGFGEAAFENADAVAADSNGNVYIHNRIYHENAISWYGGENIKVYDKTGHYIKTYFDTVYETPVLNTAVISLQNVKGKVYSFMLSKDSILVSNLANGDVVSYIMYDAQNLVSGVCYAAREKCIYVSTKDGNLWKVFEGNKPNLIYGTSTIAKGGSYFSDIAYDQEEENLYVCDIIGKNIYRLDKNALIRVRTSDIITYNLDSNNGKIYNNIYSVIREESGRFYGYSSLAFSTRLKLRHIVSFFFVIVVIMLSIYILVVVGYTIIFKLSKKQKTITAFSIVIGIVTVGFCALVASEMKSMMMEKTKEKELLTAKIINHQINAEDVKSIDSVVDYSSEEYRNIQRVIESVVLDEKGTPGELYIVLYTLERDGSVIQRYDLAGNNGCNYPYVWATGEEEAYIYETGETLIYDADSDSEGTFQFVYAPLMDEKDNVIGIMEVGCDVASFNKSINNKIFMFALAIIAVSVVFILLLLEIIEFNDAQKGLSRSELKTGSALLPVKLYRMIVFVIFFAINVTTPFLSIYALQLSGQYSAFTGISAEVLAAVPISAEVIGGAIFSMCGGFILSKLGNRKGAVCGGILFIIGLFVRVIYPNLLFLTLGNFIQGAGWGILLLIVNSQIAMYPDEKEVEQGFVDYNIAFQNGVNSGIVFGGFLLSICGYVNIVYISAIIAVIPLIYVCLYIYDGVKSEGAEGKHISVKAYMKFIFSPRVLAYFLLIVIPVVSASCYLNYLYPLIADSFGMNESIIGYSYLLNGLIVICFGNIIVNVMSKHFNKTVLMGIASVIYLITFVLIGAFENIFVLLLSLILTAISDSFGYVAQSAWYAESPEANELGYENALGVYSLFENLSQAAGSFVLGYILMAGIRKGLIVYGIVIGAAGVLFVLAAALKIGKRRRI